MDTFELDERKLGDANKTGDSGIAYVATDDMGIDGCDVCTTDETTSADSWAKQTNWLLPNDLGASMTYQGKVNTNADQQVPVVLLDIGMTNWLLGEQWTLRAKFKREREHILNWVINGKWKGCGEKHSKSRLQCITVKSALISAEDEDVALTDCPFRDRNDTVNRVDDPELISELNTPVEGPVSISLYDLDRKISSDSTITTAFSIKDESWFESASITVTCILLLGTKESGTRIRTKVEAWKFMENVDVIDPYRQIASNTLTVSHAEPHSSRKRNVELNSKEVTFHNRDELNMGRVPSDAKKLHDSCFGMFSETGTNALDNNVTMPSGMARRGCSISRFSAIRIHERNGPNVKQTVRVEKIEPNEMIGNTCDALKTAKNDPADASSRCRSMHGRADPRKQASITALDALISVWLIAKISNAWCLLIAGGLIEREPLLSTEKLQIATCVWKSNS
jgi:hypothetical protein